MWTLLLACGGDNPTDAPGGTTDATTDVGGEPCVGGESVVSMETTDGVTLEADDMMASVSGRPALVLFHMVPPYFDRSSWPKRIRSKFHDLDINVLNVDRRGAGGSGGVPEEAYFGDGALLDGEAAVSWLMSDQRGCAIDTERLMLFGASNGTTTTLDYAFGHAGDLPDVAGLAWLSPGEYTEAQNDIDDKRKKLENVSMHWLYPENEPYADDFVDGAPGTWQFARRGLQHGTDMFDGDTLEDDTVADLLALVDDVLN